MGFRCFYCDPAGHLQECFLGNPRKCSGECFRSAFWGFPESAPENASESAQKIGSAPESAFPHCFPRQSSSGSTPWSTPNFPGTLGGTLRGTSGNSQKALRKHSPEHFRGFPKKHSCKWPAGSYGFYRKPPLKPS